MESRRFWTFVAVRGAWFMLATGLTLLAVVLALQAVTGDRAQEGGTDYSATIRAKTSIGTPGDDGVLCRVTVDPGGAPDASDAPTRIRSTTGCAALPVVGAELPLTYFGGGSTVATADAASGGGSSPIPTAIVLVLAIAGWVLFARETRRLGRALDGTDTEASGRST